MDLSGMAEPAVVLNALSWERTEVVQAWGKWLRVTVPGMGYAAVDAAAGEAAFQTPQGSVEALENEVLRVAFSADGSIASVYDKENDRQVIAEGCAANRLAVYDDPGDAWDFPLDYDERPPAHFALASAEPFSGGPRAGVRFTYTYGASTLTQEVALTAGSRRLDFVARVDWRESGKMLRTSFPVAVTATEAVCEVQFGHVRRPTHRNTTWDLAKYEICAHRFIDLSDRGYGAALLNDCKYGHKARGNVLDIDLLRSPSSPDPKADRAKHEFTYSLFPHAGDHIAGGVVRAGYELNVPLGVRTVEGRGGDGGGDLPLAAWLCRVDAANVVVETVKKAEDGDDLIVRLYEAHGASCRARVSFGLPIAAAALVDLMEENPQSLEVEEGGVTLAFGPFEIHTLRLTPGG
jgi:alpha-mannosidase